MPSFQSSKCKPVLEKHSGFTHQVKSWGKSRWLADDEVTWVAPSLDGCTSLGTVLGTESQNGAARPLRTAAHRPTPLPLLGLRLKSNSRRAQQQRACQVIHMLHWADKHHLWQMHQRNWRTPLGLSEGESQKKSSLKPDTGDAFL